MLRFIQTVNKFIWGGGTFLLLCGIGFYFLHRTRWLPFRGVRAAFRAITAPQKGGTVSGVGALCTSLAATLGTGNIVGVASAMAVGGPGVLFWMQVSALLGMGIKYAEGYFGAVYRRKNGGGPFVYLEQAVHPRLARLYAVACGAGCLISLGTSSQINGIVRAAARQWEGGPSVWGVPFWGLAAGALTLLGAALVLAGGIGRIAAFSMKAVPLMGALYCGLTVWVLICHASALPQAIGLILRTAFCPRALTGAGVFQVIRLGLGRGTFSHEAGMGSEAIAAAAAENTDPHTQGLLSMLTPFFDTIVVGTLTGLAVTVTGVWRQPAAGAELSLAVFGTLPLPRGAAELLLTVSLLFFGFSSIIGWSYYGEQSFCYLLPRRNSRKLYRALFLLCLGAGIFIPTALIWETADLCCALMLFPNLIGLIRCTQRQSRFSFK